MSPEAAPTAGLWTRWPASDDERYRALGYWTGDLLGDIAVQHARVRPGATALVDARQRLTYGELEGWVSDLAAGWLELGLRRGDRVVLQIPNSVEHIVALLALLRSGIVPVMALPAHRAHEIAYFVAHSQARAYVSADRIAEFDAVSCAESLREQHPDLLHVVAPGAGGVRSDDAPPGLVTLEDVRARGVGRPAPQPPDSTDLSLLQLSGGSTGTPKLIPRMHDDYLYSVRRSVEICDLTPESVFLCVLPSAHNFALSSAGVLGALLAGATTVLSPDPSPQTAFGLIEREGVTIAGLVPPIALLWLAARPTTRRDLSSLQMLQVGGSKLSEEAARRVEPVFGCRLQQVFGMAEGLVCYTAEDDPDELVIQTQGRPMSPDDEVLVVDDDDQPVPDGEPGHLLVRGPYAIRGYYRAAEHNAQAFTADGFYRSGDLVVRRSTGHLTVVGRAKEQINRGGEKIAGEELENHLLSHPLVHEASVVGEPDQLLGEKLVAYVVPIGDAPPGNPLETGGAAATSAVRDHLAERGVATFKLPDRVDVVRELPRTGVGKTSIKALRESLVQNVSQPEQENAR